MPPAGLGLAAPPPASPAPKSLGLTPHGAAALPESDKENAPAPTQQTPARHERAASLLHKPLLGGTPARSSAPSSLLSSVSSAVGSKRPLSVLMGTGAHVPSSHGSLSVVKKLGALGLGKAQRVTASTAAKELDDEDLMPPLPPPTPTPAPAQAQTQATLTGQQAQPVSPPQTEAPTSAPSSSIPSSTTAATPPRAADPPSSSTPTPAPVLLQSSSSSSSSSSLPPMPAPAPLKLTMSSSSSSSSHLPAGPKLMFSRPVLLSTPAAQPRSPPNIIAANTAVSPPHAVAATLAPVVATPAAPAAVATPAPVVAPAAAAPAPSSFPTPSPPPAAAATPAPASTPASAPSSSPTSASTPSAPSASSLIVKTSTVVRQSYGFLLGGDRFSRLAQIGKGGSSVVYKVVSSKGAIYALKELVLPPEGHEGCGGDDGQGGGANHVPDYVTEVSNLSLMAGNPHVIQLVHACEDTTSRKVYVLMECGSCDLERHLSQTRADLSMTEFAPLLPGYYVRSLFASMVRAVQAVHARGIIHTDLKPVNFVFSASGTLKLIDFGIAKSVESGATSALYDRAVGTLNYMSPEALIAEDGAKIRASADVWSLGCILFALVYGEAPFARWSQPAAKMSRILDTREQIHLPAQVDIVEEVLTPEQSAARTLKGNGIAVAIVAPPAGSKPDVTGTVTITRTYPSMPPHLVGAELPRRSQRAVSAAVREVLRACLQRKPENRPTTAQLMAHEYVRGD